MVILQYVLPYMAAMHINMSHVCAYLVRMARAGLVGLNSLLPAHD